MRSLIADIFKWPLTAASRLGTALSARKTVALSLLAWTIGVAVGILAGVPLFMKADPVRRTNRAGAEKAALDPGKKAKKQVVKAADLEAVVHMTGRVAAVRPTIVYTPVAGRIAQVMTPAGSAATTATVLIKMDAQEQQRKVDAGKARLDQAQARADKAKETPNITPNDLRLAGLDLEIAKADFDVAQKDLAKLEIKAPGAGTLYQLNVGPGQWLPAGAEIGRIAQANKLVIEAWVPRAQAAALKADTTGTARFSSRPRDSFTVRISEISRADDSQSPPTDADLVPVQLLMEGGPHDWLRPGIYGVRIKIGARKRGLAVPLPAVHGIGGEKYVYVVADTGPELRRVETGLIGKTLVEITEGLTKGEVVRVPEL